MRSNNLCAEFSNEKRHNAKDACFHKNGHAHRHTNAQIFCHQMLYWAHKAQHIILLERLQLRHHHREHYQKQPKSDSRCYAGANAAQARQAQLAENQHIVQEGVDRQRQKINLHRQLGITQSIYKAAQRRDEEERQHAYAKTGHIPQRNVINLRCQAHALQKRRQKDNTADNYQHRKGYSQQHAMSYYRRDFFFFACTQKVGNQRHRRQ